MAQTYQTTGASRVHALLEDVPLDQPEEGKEARTRLVLRPLIVKNLQDASQPLKVAILHQKRHSAKEPWQDADSFDLRTMKAGEEVRLSLSCEETTNLTKALLELQAVADAGVPQSGASLTVVSTDDATVISGDRHLLLQKLIEAEGENLWDILEQLHPGLLQAAALKRQHQERAETVATFEAAMANADNTEELWQEFLERNEWVFGHGLDYRYLRSIQRQPNYGGVELDGAGAPRGDFLLATKAHVGFTVLVEIKTPFTKLLGAQKYRNRAYQLGTELTGAVAQMQAQCAYWALEGARQANTAEKLWREEIFTHEPQGILVVGTTAQIADDPDKRATFERFRRNLHNPRVITFDELLERARFMAAEPE